MNIYHKCGQEVWDGNRDDPSYEYCGLPYAHAGDHGDWQTFAEMAAGDEHDEPEIEQICDDYQCFARGHTDDCFVEKL